MARYRTGFTFYPVVVLLFCQAQPYLHSEPDYVAVFGMQARMKQCEGAICGMY